MEIVTRKQAKELNLKKYFTGKLCINGHLQERRVADKKCCDCTKNRDKTYTEKNKVKIKLRKKSYHSRNKESSNLKSTEWYKKNKEHKKNYNKKYGKAYYKLNKEAIKAKLKKWEDEHPEYKRAKWAKRRASKLKAKPKWANDKAIKEVYANCPDEHEVDHIIPLQGKNVCGLHVENNLQYLTKEENLKKSNKHDPTENSTKFGNPS